jgi:polar amino acid transport system substrate-binding protein
MKPQGYHILITCLWIIAATCPLFADEIEIGVSFAIPPYVIADTDQGIELDILREAFAVTGTQVEVHYLPLARTFLELSAGRIDGIINIKKGMMDNVFYSDIVIAFHNYGISLKKKGYPDFRSLDFLVNKSIVAFQRARTILGKEFAAAVSGNTRYEETAEQHLQIYRLFLERADIIVMEKQIFNYYRKQVFKATGSLAEQPVTFHNIFPPSEYRFAFRVEEIRDDFNLGLETIRQNGCYDRIIKKYEALMLLDQK